jgi:transposase
MNRRQTIPKHLRYTLDQFRQDFPTDDVCLETIKNKRYPGGVTFCSDCGQERKLYRVSGRMAYACEAGHQFYPLAGTIFEKSTTALHIWFYAMYQMGSTRCGISAKQIQRETGVTYKTAWRIFKQIRSLLSEPDMQLEGSTIEIDETYHGRKAEKPSWLSRNARTRQ